MLGASGGASAGDMDHSSARAPSSKVVASADLVESYVEPSGSANVNLNDDEDSTIHLGTDPVSAITLFKVIILLFPID